MSAFSVTYMTKSTSVPNALESSWVFVNARPGRAVTEFQMRHPLD